MEILQKQPFTAIIVTLYAANFIYQIFFTKDYVWGWYWFSALNITVAATLMSNRP